MSEQGHVVGPPHRDADARFVGRIMLLGGSWANQGVELLANRDLVQAVANLEDEDLITVVSVQAILAEHGYPQTDIHDDLEQA